MPQSLSQIYVHLVFSTKYRVPMIKKDDYVQIHNYLGGILNNLGCDVIRVGGVQNHVHILFRLSRKIAIADVVKNVKASSSHFIKSLGNHYRNFAWQEGYGAFSIGKSHLDRAIRYVSNQEQHHKARIYQEEFLEFLKLYDVEYDERYLWD